MTVCTMRTSRRIAILRACEFSNPVSRSSPRRRRPIRRVLADMAQRSTLSRRNGLWVPAFAGTTPDWPHVVAVPSIDDAEPRQRESLRRVILVHHLDLLPYVVDILRQAIADQRGGHEWSLVKFDQRVDVGDLVLPPGMKRHVVTVDGEDLAAPARFRPFHVGGERLVLVVDAEGFGPVRRAAFLAAPDQKLMFLQPLVKVLVVLVDVRERPVPRLVRHDDVRL